MLNEHGRESELGGLAILGFGLALAQQRQRHIALAILAFFDEDVRRGDQHLAEGRSTGTPHHIYVRSREYRVHRRVGGIWPGHR